jgi:hypothetical protein
VTNVVAWTGAVSLFTVCGSMFLKKTFTRDHQM